MPPRTAVAPGGRPGSLSPSTPSLGGVDHRHGHHGRPLFRRWRPYLSAGAIYLVLSLLLWWHVLPNARFLTTCGCGDGALTLWVIKWPAYALSHGLNPLYSSKLFVPRGINMAPNSLGLGIVTAPVTWLLGPVASLNLIDVVSPLLSALAMFWLLRRWLSWAPAAFAGGLFFGFSPFVLVSLALAHPNFGLLAPMPLIVGCLDDLFLRRHHRPRTVGMVLGLLLVVEFAISVEILLLVALFTAVAAVIVVVRDLVRRGHQTARAVRRAAPGVGAAAVVALLLLAYPLWFFFAGPAHLVGRAWPDAPSGTVANTPGQFVTGFISAPLTGIMHLFGGYQGPTLPLLCYLGFGVVVVVGTGLVIWRRDPLILFFGLMGLVAAVLSLGVVSGSWTPWRLFTHLPVLNNVVPVNISAIVDMCAAVVLGCVVEHVRTAVRSRFARAPRAFAPGAAAGAVAVLALAPVAAALWPNLPMTVRAVVVPRWFTRTAPHLGAATVVLPYPAALGGIQSSMAWQAVEGMSFSMVGGGGPGITPSRAGPEKPGFTVLSRASVPLGPAPVPTAAATTAVRRALAGWGVTTVVVPDQPDMPSYDRGRSVAYAVGLFTAVLGEPPHLQSSAWVWSDVRSSPPPVPLSSSAFDDCTGGPGPHPTGSEVAACVLRAR